MTVSQSRRKKLSSSAQDYIEAIYLLGREHGVVRVSQIAERLAVKMPSVVVALKALARQGLIAYERYGYVTMTEAGRAAARRIYERHDALRRFLNGFLGVDEVTAEADACRIEHALSPRTVEQLNRFLAWAGELPVSRGDEPPAYERLFTRKANGRCRMKERKEL